MPSTPYHRVLRPVILHTSDISLMSPQSFPSSAQGIVSWKTLFSSPHTPTDSLTVGIATCPAGSGTSRPIQNQNQAGSPKPGPGHLKSHRHAHAEMYYVTAGKGCVTIDGIEYEVRKESVVFIPGNAEHGIRNTGTEEGEEGGDLVWLIILRYFDMEKPQLRTQPRDSEEGFIKTGTEMLPRILRDHGTPLPPLQKAPHRKSGLELVDTSMKRANKDIPLLIEVCTKWVEGIRSCISLEDLDPTMFEFELFAWLDLDDIRKKLISEVHGPESSTEVKALDHYGNRIDLGF
ncbi:hypothetical protein EK21DRAFT_87923 [Setomelanomma holmii]|uniref:Cupin type-2 domain-containing protein n=1 Tax=Setomelanomma holmii TaxID=210430 RepID=A0A9P4LQB4_9PLEO|nr:hypothetical protein EK21DRAFT_87923 [Setomelanomma holmii]